MPTVVNAARVTTKDGAVWRHCDGCGLLVALPPEIFFCPACTPIDGAGLSRVQVDGRACIVCGATDAPMVAAGCLPGWGQVVACAHHEGRS
jgi:hypothetical protein